MNAHMPTRTYARMNIRVDRHREAVYRCIAHLYTEHAQREREREERNRTHRCSARRKSELSLHHGVPTLRFCFLIVRTGSLVARSFPPAEKQEKKSLHPPASLIGCSGHNRQYRANVLSHGRGFISSVPYVLRGVTSFDCRVNGLFSSPLQPFRRSGSVCTRVVLIVPARHQAV